MCLNNVNANCFICKSVKVQSGTTSFDETFNRIGINPTDGEVYLPNCHIVILIGAIEDVLDDLRTKIIPCKLTLVSKDTGAATEIANFKFDPNNNIMASDQYQCKHFANTRLIVHLENLKLNSGYGTYLLKLWMKDTDKWKIQAMYPLTVEKPRN